MYAAPDFLVLLAVIPNKMISGTGIQFVKQLDDTGSGQVTLNMDDPFWQHVTLPNAQPAHYLLDWEHLWQVTQDGVPRMEFLGETVTEQLVDPSEQRIATITGPGTLATLKWAMVAPNGFGPPPAGVITYKTDAITDGFDEIDVNGNLVLDRSLWNAASATGVALNPAGTAQLTASTGTTFLGTTAYDATNSLLSAQVSPIVSPTFAGVVLDGSQLTQMYIQSLKNANNYVGIGMSSSSFYAFMSGPGGLVTHIIASAANFNLTQSNNGNYSYWQISEKAGVFYAWTSPDGQNWTKQWTIAHGWDATSCAVYFSAKYDTNNKVFAQVTAINSNVVTSSLGGPSYFAEPIIGGVWLDQLNRAQARGTVPFVTTGPLSLKTDSFFNPWGDTNNVQLTNGTDLLSLLQGQVSMINADYIMQPGFRLQVGIPQATGQITLGFDRSHQVIFRDGMDCQAKTRQRTRNQIQNLIAVINADGRTVTTDEATSASEYGQREGWLQAAAQVTTADLNAVASAAGLENSVEILSQTLQISPYLPNRTIFTGFDVGDWVGLERPDFSAIDKVRVTAIAVQVATDGSETHELTLVTYIQWLQEQLQYIATKLGGGFVSTTGTTAIAGNGSLSGQTPTVFNITLDGLGGVSSNSAAAHSPLVFDTVTGQWVSAGTVNPDTATATPMIVSGTNGQVVVAGDGSTVMVSAPPSTPADVGTPGAVVHTLLGLQSDGTITQQDFNGVPPLTPDTPTVAGLVNGILVTWDGLLTGFAPLRDFMWMEVHTSTSSGFTPSSATLRGTMTTAGSFSVGNLTLGTTYYAKLLARNTSGVASTASAQASGVPVSLTASVIGEIGVLNLNPFFAGGDGTGWAGFNGTFSVSSSPPAGSPYTYAGFFTLTTSGGAAEESGQPFRVASSVPYLCTAWVYSSDTSAVVGFDWEDVSHAYISTSTQTFTVTANTWTLVTTVQTSAATAVWAYPRVAPGTVGDTIYFEACLCLPQVPGGLIQAGTITATQIAAGIIVAGIVNGTLIQGATLVADGSSGELLVYSSTPALGDLIMAVSATTGVDSSGNHFPAGVNIGLWDGTGTLKQHLGVDTSGRLYVAGPDGVTRIQINNGTGSVGPDIRFYNDFGAVILVVDPSAGGTFQYEDLGSATQGVLIGSQSSKNTTDPVNAGTVGAGVTVIDPVFGDFMTVVGATITMGIGIALTRTSQIIPATAGTSAKNPYLKIDAPEETTTSHLQALLCGASPDGTSRPAQQVIGAVSGSSTLTPNTLAMLDLQGSLGLTGISAPASPPAGSAILYSDTNGMPRALSGLAGDTNIYGPATMTQSLASDVPVPSTTPATVFTFEVGIATYVVRGCIRGVNGASGTLQPQSMRLGGTCTASHVNVRVLTAAEVANTTAPPQALGAIGSLGTSPNNTRTPALNEVFHIIFEGTVVVSVAGTLVLQAREETSGSDVSWTAKAYGTTMTLIPV